MRVNESRHVTGVYTLPRSQGVHWGLMYYGAQVGSC